MLEKVRETVVSDFQGECEAFIERESVDQSNNLRKELGEVAFSELEALIIRIVENKISNNRKKISYEEGREIIHKVCRENLPLIAVKILKEKGIYKGDVEISHTCEILPHEEDEPGEIDPNNIPSTDLGSILIQTTDAGNVRIPKLSL